MRRSVLYAAVVAFALLLAGCQVTVTGPGDGQDPFPEATQVDATLDPDASFTVTVPANDSVVLEVALAGDVLDQDLMYFELGTTALELALYNASGTILASSTTDAVFRRGALALESAGSTPVAPQVTVATTCRGTCILFEADRSRFFLVIFNPTSSAVTTEVFLFSEPFSDQNEPNDTLAAAVNLFRGDVDEGAVETLGDEDVFAIEQSGVLEFNTDSQLDLVVEVVNASGESLGAFRPGSTVNVQEGFTAIVHERGDDAAGVAAASFYTISLQ